MSIPLKKEKDKCPVCNETIKDKRKAFKYKYKGKTYYLCSELCKDAFKEGPLDIIKKRFKITMWESES